MSNKILYDDIKSIVFVCTGNTCRSPMAEALMKKLLKENNISDITVFSRGISVFENSGASENSIKAIKKYDIDLSIHRAKGLTFEEVRKTDLILTMSEEHKFAVLSAFPEYKNKAYTLYEFAFDETKDILDPFGGSLSVYENCLNEIYKCVKKLIGGFLN